MATQTSNRAVAHLRLAVPTHKTQDLYNKMRKEEEKPTLQGLREQDTSPGFLGPPSPSQATTTSRSPSCASTTRSVAGAMNGMGVGGDPSRIKKTRATRRGPLTEAGRLRAALMRELGACTDCRARRVKVRQPE